MSEYKTIRQLEEVIKEQQVAITQISHEIRNPVTLINSSLQLIEKEHPEVQNFAFWKETRSDMAYLMKLLDELSNYNNIDNINLEVFPASKWLGEIAVSVKSVTPDQIDFQLEIPPDLPAFTIDSVKLRQAVTNLLRNAFEALTGPGQVIMSAHTDKDSLIIQIRDSGCGIPDEYLADLFTPFITHKKGGTGLGLTITKRVIDAHNGSITVSSVQNEGTTFTITLPLDAGIK